MQVSIVIINYNTFELSCSCIQSVMDMTRGVSYEIILVDNASTERSASEFLNRFPNIILSVQAQNLGFAKGNNAGIDMASGDVILLLNSDTVLLNDAVTVCWEFLSSNPQVAVVSARLEFPDGELQHCCQRFPSIGPKLFEVLRLQKALPRKIGARVLMGYFFDHQSVAYPDWVWGTFFMFRRASLQDLPGQHLADDFFMYVEDMQWCMEFQKRGHLIAFEPSARVLHLMGRSGGPRSKLIDQHIQRFMKMYYTRPERWIIRLLDQLLNLRN